MKTTQSNPTGFLMQGPRLAWARGPARLEDGMVVLDSNRAEVYPAMGAEVENLLFDLADVRRPTDALGFVRRYGLLTKCPGRSFSQDTPGLSNDEIVELMKALREQFAELWEPIARGLNDSLRLYDTLNRAEAGARSALKDLRETYVPQYIQSYVKAELGELADLEIESDAEVVEAAKGLLATRIAQGLGYWAADFLVVPAAGQGFAFEPQPQNLVGVAFAQLALLVVNRIPIATCPECGRVFQVKHGRQRYHDKQCNDRARYRRHADKKRREANGEKGES